uniref:Uncharacterized protein n=1 Tax=viral metagenome TaxID=1070528 RepID=A0A6M3J3J6_9ZZZZ
MKKLLTWIKRNWAKITVITVAVLIVVYASVLTYMTFNLKHEVDTLKGDKIALEDQILSLTTEKIIIQHSLDRALASRDDIQETSDTITWYFEEVELVLMEALADNEDYINWLNANAFFYEPALTEANIRNAQNMIKQENHLTDYVELKTNLFNYLDQKLLWNPDLSAI